MRKYNRKTRERKVLIWLFKHLYWIDIVWNKQK